MATLKLMNPPAATRADGWHGIAAPGGYEAWHFHAEDLTQRIRIVFSFHHGLALHPDYLRRFDAYRRRPTCNRPPLPSQYPCLHWAIYENKNKGENKNKEPLASSTTQFPPGAFQADGTSLTLGPNRLIFSRDDIIAHLSRIKESFSAELVFQPILQAGSVQSILADHYWLPSRPLCQVLGEIRLGARTIAFQGLGRQNQYYGTAPLAYAAARWMRGGVLFPRAAVAFQTADDHATVILADEAGTRRIENSPFIVNSTRRTLRLPPHPSAIDFGNWLILRNGRVADSSPAQLQLLFDAYVDGEQSTAWVEIAYPKRLSGFLARRRAERFIAEGST
ncbi:MAG: hypothetical protein ABSC42_05025 [Tepidisphaeraceae bacterium]|jgi:hypothetical protein